MKAKSRKKTEKKTEAAKPKIKPPVINVRAGGEGERIALAVFPDGASLEVTFRTRGAWHEVCADGVVLDHVEVKAEADLSPSAG